MSALAEYNKGV